MDYFLLALQLSMYAHDMRIFRKDESPLSFKAMKIYLTMIFINGIQRNLFNYIIINS